MPARFSLPILIGLLLAAVYGCSAQFDSGMATFNANATKIASGGREIGTLIATAQPTAGPTLTPTPAVHRYDLIADSSELLIHAWGQVYALPAGSQFEIIAEQRDVADFVVASLQLQGFKDTVRGGTVTLAVGQMRVDLDLVGADGATGTATITYQPTLDAAARLQLNMLGSDYGALRLPAGLPLAIDQAVMTSLSGAANESLSKITFSSLSLESGAMTVSGRRR